MVVLNYYVGMGAKRKTTTEKVLGIIGAACDDLVEGVSELTLPYSELRKRVKYSGYCRETSLSKTIYNLRQSGYLEVVEKDATKAIKLTRKGRFKTWKPEHLESRVLDYFTTVDPAISDGK